MKLVKLIDHLDHLQWDLAEFCLERCKEPVSQIAAAIGIDAIQLELATTTEKALTGAGNNDLSVEDVLFPSANDLFLSVDYLDYSWETIWDSLEGPYPGSF